MGWLEIAIEFLIHRPLLLMALMALPLLAAWMFKRCFPSRRLLWWMLLPLLLSFTLLAAPNPVWPSLIVNLFLLGLAGVDLLTVAPARCFEAHRDVLKIASLGKKQACQLTMIYRGDSTCSVELRDDLPQAFTPDVERFHHRFHARSRFQFHYQFTSLKRGRFEMRGVHLRVRSRLGFWNAYYEIPVLDEIFVYPDMKQISQYAVLARTDRLNLLGVRRSRRIGQDNEFERLRDYTQDDNYKHIDWRTTARRQKLMVKDFQANQSQRIIFMVDGGRMMTSQSGGISLLDQALNSMLMLSYVALRQGDSVGLICFSNDVHSYTPPRTGVKQVNRLLHAAFDQHASYVESRYDLAFMHLRKNCPRRSLVILITNVIDEINARLIREYLAAIGKHHLPLGVLLRDHQVFDTIDDYLVRPTPDRPDRYYPAAVAARLINWRQQVLTQLHHQGALTLDVFPEELTASLVNRYLEIKARHLL